MPCPDPHPGWKPVPHADVYDLTASLAPQHGLVVVPGSERFSLGRGGLQMFGTVDLAQGDPGEASHAVSKSGEYNFSFGFVNSHDKSIALRVAFGQHVFVCDNMMVFASGPAAYLERRLHTTNVDPSAIISRALDAVGAAAESMLAESDRLMSLSVSRDRGSEILFLAAECGALPASRAVHAHMDWKKSFDDEPVDIEHPGTAWALVQAITAQWKHFNGFAVPGRSAALETLLAAAL